MEEKNKKGLIIGIILVIVLALCIAGLLLFLNKKNQNHIYTIITDERVNTIVADGSYVSQYYEIDLAHKKYAKYEEKYDGAKGAFEYERKELYSKKLTKAEKEELETIINTIISNKSSEINLVTSGYLYYILEVMPKENEDPVVVMFNDYELIGKMEKIIGEEETEESMPKQTEQQTESK